MLLYVNGDSHSCGHDAGGIEFSYGKIIAKELNSDFICDAEIACDNDTVISKTTKFLETNTADFIIIGWSTWERECWSYNNEKFYVAGGGHNILPEQLQERYKKYVIDTASPEGQRRKEKENYNKIWDFHCFLKSKNIKHLFFNCFSYFHYTYWWKEDSPKDQQKWYPFYIDPYNKHMTYFYWLQEAGYKPSNPKYYHYGPDAHQAWAYFLLLKIQNILTDNW